MFPAPGRRATVDLASVRSGPSSSNTIGVAVLPSPPGSPQDVHGTSLSSPERLLTPGSSALAAPLFGLTQGSSPQRCPPTWYTWARAQCPASSSQSPVPSIQSLEPHAQCPVMPCQPPQEPCACGFHTLEAPCHSEVHPVPSFTPGAQSETCNSWIHKRMGVVGGARTHLASDPYPACRQACAWPPSV